MYFPSGYTKKENIYFPIKTIKSTELLLGSTEIGRLSPTVPGVRKRYAMDDFWELLDLFVVVNSQPLKPCFCLDMS